LLGAAVVRRLQNRGDTVTVFQRRPSGLDVREVLGDITDQRSLKDVVAGVELVIHAAARVTVVGPWSAFADTNIAGTAHLLDAARREGVQRFVYISSPSVANRGNSLFGVAAAPADPALARDNYSRSKAVAEQIALRASGSGLAVVAIRPHLVWGPGDRQLIGRIVERLRQRRMAIIGSGAALIDTTYVDNAADAIVSAADRVEKLSGRALVVSNGQPRTVRELIDKIARAADVAAPRVRVPVVCARGAGEVFERAWSRFSPDSEPPVTRFLAEQMSTAHWFDQRETRRVLEWTPAIDIEEGFTRLEQWFRTSTEL
jgi:nucleoside-diphosphate-sugar epimerase